MVFFIYVFFILKSVVVLCIKSHNLLVNAETRTNLYLFGLLLNHEIGLIIRYFDIILSFILRMTTLFIIQLSVAICYYISMDILFPLEL